MLQTQERLRPAAPGIGPTAALRGFFAITDAWGLSAEEARTLLGGPAERTFYAWRSGKAVRVRWIPYAASATSRASIRHWNCSIPIRILPMGGSGDRIMRLAARRLCSACVLAMSPILQPYAPIWMLPGRRGAEACHLAVWTGRRPGGLSLLAIPPIILFEGPGWARALPPAAPDGSLFGHRDADRLDDGGVSVDDESARVRGS